MNIIWHTLKCIIPKLLYILVDNLLCESFINYFIYSAAFWVVKSNLNLSYKFYSILLILLYF